MSKIAIGSKLSIDATKKLPAKELLARLLGCKEMAGIGIICAA